MVSEQTVLLSSLAISRMLCSFIDQLCIDYFATGKTGSAAAFWTTVEVSIGVLAACLPPLGPLLRMVPGPRKLYYSFRHSLSSRSRTKHDVHGTERFEELNNNGKDGHFAMNSSSQKIVSDNDTWYTSRTRDEV